MRQNADLPPLDTHAEAACRDTHSVAQANGKVSARFSSVFLLSPISAVCTAWVPSNWYASQIDPEAARHPDLIVRLIAMMIAPDPKSD